MEVRVRVRTLVKKEGIALLPDGRLEVSVRADAKAGAANERVLVLLAQYFAVPRARVSVVRGHRTPTKTIRVA